MKDPPYRDTEVHYTRTKAEIECLLKSYGVKGVRWTALEGQDDVLEFIVEADVKGVKRSLGISVSPPHIFIQKKLNGRLANTENPNQEYRLLFYWIKSKIEAVMWGLSTIEKEFLSQITTALPDGTVTSVGEIVTDLLGKDRLPSLSFLGEKKPPIKNVTGL
jgi:hypothetical protein